MVYSNLRRFNKMQYILTSNNVLIIDMFFIHAEFTPNKHFRKNFSVRESPVFRVFTIGT